MKLVLMIADGLNLMSYFVATPFLRILATFAPMAPLPAMIMSQNLKGIHCHVQISFGSANKLNLGPMRVDCLP